MFIDRSLNPPRRMTFQQPGAFRSRVYKLNNPQRVEHGFSMKKIITTPTSRGQKYMRIDLIFPWRVHLIWILIAPTCRGATIISPRRGGLSFPKDVCIDIGLCAAHFISNLKKLIEDYSVRKLFTGFANNALMVWKLTVIKAIRIANDPAIKNIHQAISMR